jgi:NAD+ diphosphatase
MLEEALTREVREELSLEITSLEYIHSFPNRYLYKNIEYSTCDAFFYTRVDNIASMQYSDEVTEISWLNPLAVDQSSIAFESIKLLLQYFQNNGFIVA